jgi:nicotinamidase-related amidase
MSHPSILNINQTALIVVDIQEAFRSVISDFPMIAEQTSLAVRGFHLLGIPILVTEQYPKGLGKTAEEIYYSLPDGQEFIEKTTFSSCAANNFIEKLNAIGAKQIVLGGLETHICVSQTAHDLLDAGFQVHLLADCVASRNEHNKDIAINKMTASGVILTCVEMALFELMRDSKHEKFKEIQGLVK